MLLRTRQAFAHLWQFSAIAAIVCSHASAATSVNWIVDQNTSTITFSGATYLGGTAYNFQEVSPGSLSAPLSGYFDTNNTITTNLIFGGGVAPTYPGKPSDTSQYAQWADVDFPAAAAAINHVIGGYTGNYQPTFPLPSVPIPISPLPANAGPASPGLFGGTMLNDLSTDPPGYSPFAFRNFNQTFFTNTNEAGKPDPQAPNYDPLYPAYLPTGAAVDGSGHFNGAAIATSAALFWDVYAPDFYGGALTGRSPLTETIKNFSSSDGVIGRNGPAYTMTFINDAVKFLVGKDVPSSVIDIGTQQHLVVHATANIALGDGNFDGVVNGLDISLVASNWLHTDAAHLGPGDVNGDGVVNGLDISMIASNWLHTTPPLPGNAAAATVPEPSAIVLGIMACVCGLIGVRMRRRR